MVGFWRADAKPLGPLHAYVAPAPDGVEAVSCSVSPAHTAPPLPAAGGAGTAFTVVETDDASFAADGSLVDEATDAVFVAVPADAGAVITIVMGGAAPTASAGRVHVTVVVPPQLQPVPPADTSAAPAGRTSVAVTDAAAEGPAFETVSMYAIGWPVQIEAGAPLCPMERSARAKTLDGA